MIRYIIAGLLVIFCSLPVFAQNLEQQYSLWMNDQKNQIHCFDKRSAFQYCLRESKDGKLIVADKTNQEIYQIYYFDNWPDEAQDGVYRIRQGNKIGFADAVTGKIVIDAIYDCAYPFEDGKAKVGIGCKTETDGEHSWWVGGDWTTITRP